MPDLESIARDRAARITQLEQWCNKLELDRAALMKRVERAEALVGRFNRAMAAIGCAGSEFYDAPERCARARLESRERLMASLRRKAAEVRRRWLPIFEALDGTRVLLWDAAMDPPEYIGLRRGGDWFDDHGHLVQSPTHCMPLPEPPKEEL